MEIGNQIKALRQRRGLTQEDMAQHFGITPQAVSKWERGVATPDIGLLPDISAYFGVTIDELFALSDETRMERIQNMLWDVRYIPQADVDSAREYLLEKAKREPQNGRPHELLADMENHLAREHQQKAEEYAKEALRRDPELREAHGELNMAMGGRNPDWNGCNHYLQIDYYQEFLRENPENWGAHMWIMDQLIDDYRLDEANAYCDAFARINSTYRVPLYRGMIAWQRGERDKAFSIWGDMEEKYPDEWCVYHHIADYLIWAGRGDEAEAYYRKAIDIQKAPRLVDPFEALAQYYEIKGDYSAAIRILNEELDIFDKEWHFTTGETADFVRRHIQRLKKKQGSTLRKDNSDD